MIRSPGPDYPEDAPTVAVKDLSALGIDLAEFATGSGAPVREAPVVRPPPPRRAPASPVVERVRPPAETKGEGASMTFLVLAATVPVLAAATIAALILLA